ncbi:hypothetical protein XELAEV_18019414mg [Xenopus laevis]|uniref:Olfactory receptor n=1 Tax=Xenopus laevis TaxID=8355 RepID=A0A974HUE7_XENLA|nr:hypothetical protein XELAEV_18019414mg [Xenopus laevis]
MCSLIVGSNRNQTEITHFILQGIGGPHSLKMSFYFIFLTLYIMTMCGNLLIIGLFLQSHHLNSPMYFFLSHLSICDILLSTSVVPNLLSTLLKEHETTFRDSITQFFATSLATAAESFTVIGYPSTCLGARGECHLLTLISYDRYLAICNPLCYTSIMSTRLCVLLVACSWFLSFLYCLIATIEILDLDFCGCNVLNSIFCDIAPLLEISCRNASRLQLACVILASPGILFTFSVILSTYIKISLTILSISSSIGKQKALATCSSHLTVVCTYFGILIVKYTVPSNGQSLNMNKAISLSLVHSSYTSTQPNDL